MYVDIGKIVRLLPAGLLLVAAPLAVADVADPAFYIEASNDSGTAVYQVPLAGFTYNPVSGEYALDQWAPINLTDGADYVARLSSLHLYMVDDPGKHARIIMNFGVEAGESVTTFTVTPGSVALLSTIPQEYSAAKMSWAFTLADKPGTDAYAALTGVPAGDDIYGALYNGTESFGNSVSFLEADGDGAVNTAWDNIPSVGYEDLPAAVSGISVATAFTLTPLDTADIQSTFVLDLPEPASVMLLVLGVAALRRRR